MVNDPYLNWCNEHLHILKNYPDSHVAIDISLDGNDAIVAHGKTNEEFVRALNKIPKEQISKIVMTHTARYV